MDDAEELRARIEAKVAARRSEVPPARRERTRRRARDDDSAPEDQDDQLPFEDLPVPRSLEPAGPWLAAEGDLGPDEDDEPGKAGETTGEPAGDADPEIGARTLQPIRPWLFQSQARPAQAPEAQAPTQEPSPAFDPGAPRELDPTRPWTRPRVAERERSFTAPANAASVLRPLAEEMAAAAQDAEPVARRGIFGRHREHVDVPAPIGATQPIADEVPPADEPLATGPVAAEPIAAVEHGSRRFRRRTQPAEPPVARHAVPPGQAAPSTIESIVLHEPEPADWVAELAAAGPLMHREQPPAEPEPVDEYDRTAEAAGAAPGDALGEAHTGRLRRTVGWLFEQAPQRDVVPTLLPPEEDTPQAVAEPPVAEPGPSADVARQLAALHDPGYDPLTEPGAHLPEEPPGVADATDEHLASAIQTASIGDLRPTLDWSQLRPSAPPPADTQPEQPEIPAVSVPADRADPTEQTEQTDPTESTGPEAEAADAPESVPTDQRPPAALPHRVRPRPRPYASAPVIQEPFQPKTGPAADPTSTAQTRGSWLSRDHAPADAAGTADDTSGPAEKLDRGGSEPTRRWVRTGVRLSVVLAIIAAAVIALRLFVVAPYYIPSASMEPTLHGCPGCNNDHVLVDKLSYRMHAIHRGDVVVFNRPRTWAVSEKVLIKRVVGLPGDTLSVRNGHLLVNGLVLNEPYVNPACPAMSSLGEAPQKPTTVIATIPPDTVFVMGDNRCDSTDSRAFGVVPASTVIGRAFLIIWPFGRLHFL